MKLGRSGLAFFIVLLSAFQNMALAESETVKPDSLILTDEEISKIIRHGPWPPQIKPDPSNLVSGNKDAIIFGKTLFFEPRLSANGKVSCSSCHDPALGWTDGEPRAGGIARLDRNTQSLFNVAGNRWFGLDGRNDSLWGHSIGPILNEKEMGLSEEGVALLVRSDAAYSKQYAKVFGRSPDQRKPIDLTVDVAKALAAFQETIISPKAPFDEFTDALAAGDYEAAGQFPVSAQRGASLFFGRGNCSLCHLGPNFTNEEFDDVGVPYFTAPGRVDRGRQGGILKLKASPFNLLGRHSDALDPKVSWATRQVAENHRTFGQFKVPSLRQLTKTAPFMHDGSLETIEDVIDHYSNINLERIHADGLQILKPLNLNEQESLDLLNFLKSLSVD